MSDSFEYRAQARNPVGYLAFGLGFALAVSDWALHFSTATWALTALYVLAMFVRLSLNPRTGFRVDARMIEVFGPGFHRMIPLANVESVRISQGGRGISCDLFLSCGEELSVPSQMRIGPTALANAFRARGIVVIA
jgi:hypothetical protein